MPLKHEREQGERAMKIKTMEDLFIHELRDLYHAEKQLTKALPKMAKAATDEELRTAFEEHLEETQNQVARLEQIFSELDIPSRGVKCAAMEGLVEEGQEAIKEIEEDEVRDAALIAAAQRVEHYEIAGYGCAKTFAERLGHDNVAQLLQETLDEEHAADQKLNEIAMSSVNEEAVAAE